MNTRGQVGPVIALILLLVFLYVAITSTALLATIIINSIIGIVLLLIVNLFPIVKIKINIWTILIAGFGGLLGVALLVLLDLAGVDV